MVVTHDRYFLDNVTNWILEIERGRGFPFEGNYTRLLAGAEAQADAAGGEGGEPPASAPWPPNMEWIGRQSPARGKRRSKARIQKYEELLAKSQEQVSRRRSARDRHPARPAPGRHRDRGREALRKAFGNRLLIDDLDFALPPGGIVGVIGPNGAGKTTLFRMITGQDTARCRRAAPSARR